MNEILQTPLFLVCLNFGAYLLGAWILKVLHIRWMNALFVAIFITIGTLLLLNIPYDVYYRGSELFNFLLGPTVVALGYVLHKQIMHIKGRTFSIVVSIIIGAFVNLAVINIVLLLFNSELSIIYSLQPKSVTTPIALSLAERNNGMVSITAVAVAITGIFGNTIGPTLLNWAKIKDPVAKGLALGSSAHAIGTAKALELGAIEGAISGLAIGLMGAVTAIVLSFCSNLFL